MLMGTLDCHTSLRNRLAEELLAPADMSPESPSLRMMITRGEQRVN